MVTAFLGLLILLGAAATTYVLLEKVQRTGRYFIWPIIVSVTLGTVFAALGTSMGVVSAEASSALTRLSGLVADGFCLLALMMALLRSRAPTHPAVLWGYLLFVLGAIVTVPWSTEPAWATGLFSTPLVLLGLYACVLTGVTRQDFFSVTRTVLSWVLVGSLALLVVAPGLASTPYVDSRIGLPIRLHGITFHANMLGLLAAMYLVLLLAPDVSKRGRVLGAALGLAVLVLAQSKTVVGGLLIGVGLIGLAQMFRAPTLTQRALLFLAMPLVILGGGSAVRSGLSDADAGVTTLTGRTQIWEITLGSWRDNPTFGYGPHLWDNDYARLNNAEWAGYAHNQLIHTLGQSGTVGAVGWAIFTLVMLRALWGALRRREYILVLLGTVLLTREVSEVPLYLGRIDTTTLFVGLIVIGLATREMFHAVVQVRRRTHPSALPEPA
ncbi:O-antigen ligase family protein [Deinococcus apachensis]|uniref:O-antigen ligase family protein n=1 Tax=Deinococcus apachensis TaxID=309886 RepID=UPI00036D6369|nr:O-antigen ligase family protein [Deinococcus apachensis]